MRKYFVIIFAILLLSSLTWSDDGAEGSFKIKHTGVGHENSKVKAAEFRDDKAAVGFALNFTSPAGDNGIFLFSGHQTTIDDQAFGFSYWTGPHFRIQASYNEFVHNKIHDPLSNLAGVSDVKVQRHTDLNPYSEYGIVYSETNARIDYSAHGYEDLKFFASFRDQAREGWKQARAQSKCASCHVVGMDRRVDQKTRDGQVGINLTVKNFRLAVSHLQREFNENGVTPTFTYENAQHPSLLTPVFEDRIQYDDDDGPLPFDQIPDVKKFQNNLRLDVNWSSGNFLASLANANVENETTNNEFDYNAYLAGIKQKLSQKTTLKLRFRTYEIDNDDYFVDSVERVAIAGPYVGETYREHYGFNPDFLRRSAMNRTVNDGLAELRFRYTKKGRLKFGYRYLSTDRDHLEVSEGKRETVKNTFYVDWRHWLPKSWKFNANLSYSDISHPFANVDGGCNPDMNTTPVPSPLAPGSVQYWERHDAREFNLSKQPSESLSFRLAATRPIKGTTHLMFNARYKDEKNDELDFSTWERDFLMASVYINWMIGEKWSWFGGYNYSEDNTQTHICIPVMDG